MTRDRAPEESTGPGPGAPGDERCVGDRDLVTWRSRAGGHSLNAFVVAGVVAYLLILRQRARLARGLTVAVALGFALTMGMRTVYLGHHWFSDVLVAQTLGAAWLALVLTAHRLYLTARHRNRPRPIRRAPLRGVGRAGHMRWYLARTTMNAP